MDHSYEEIRKAVIYVLMNKEKPTDEPTQYESLKLKVGKFFLTQKGGKIEPGQHAHLSPNDRKLFLEIFWELFRQGIITLGLNEANKEFPFFRITQRGKEIINYQYPYFFYDTSSYEKILKEQIPDIDEVTLIYLKESLQAFYSGCILAATVMLGVSAEHEFNRLIEVSSKNTKYKSLFESVKKERFILQRITKFQKRLEQIKQDFPKKVKEGLDINLLGILEIIRKFRNESGHPTGEIISLEQCYTLIQLYIPFCKKIYQLIDFFK